MKRLITLICFLIICFLSVTGLSTTAAAKPTHFLAQSRADTLAQPLKPECTCSFTVTTGTYDPPCGGGLWDNTGASVTIQVTAADGTHCSQLVHL